MFLYGFSAVDLSVYRFPCEGFVFKHHVAVMGVLLRDGERAGIDVGKALVTVVCRDVRVTAEENFTVFEGRGIAFAKVVSV